MDVWESVWGEWEVLRNGGEKEEEERNGESHVCGAHTYTDLARGDVLCMECGAVVDSILHDEYGRTIPLHNVKPASMYKRKHHWNERISQWLVGVRRVPNPVIERVKSALRLADVSMETLTKTDIRKVLRALKLQKHIEHWVEIYCMVKERPFPVCDSEKVEEIREQFLAIECAFMKHQPTGRKCMINYNYLFNRLASCRRSLEAKRNSRNSCRVLRLSILLWSRDTHAATASEPPPAAASEPARASAPAAALVRKIHYTSL